MILFLSGLLLKELTMQIWFDGLFRDFFSLSLSLFRGLAKFAPITSI